MEPEMSHDRAHAMDHVVLVLFENRSFDNVLGHLYGQRTSVEAAANVEAIGACSASPTRRSASARAVRLDDRS